MQSDVSHSCGKVDVSAAVGGHYKHVRANQEGSSKSWKVFGQQGVFASLHSEPIIAVKNK